MLRRSNDDQALAGLGMLPLHKAFSPAGPANFSCRICGGSQIPLSETD
jgi:hypothetical protein